MATNMQYFERKYSMPKGNSIEDAIVINAHDTITGVTEEHNYIDQLCKELDTGVESIAQNLIIEKQKTIW